MKVKREKIHEFSIFRRENILRQSDTHTHTLANIQLQHVTLIGNLILVELNHVVCSSSEIEE